MKKRSFRSRLVGAAIGLGAFFLFAWLFFPRTVELVVTVPEGHPPVSVLDVRIVSEDGAEAYRGRRTRPEPGRSLFFSVQLKSGRYELRAWPGDDAPALGARFTFDGEERLEVMLEPAS